MFRQAWYDCWQVESTNIICRLFVLWFWIVMSIDIYTENVMFVVWLVQPVFAVIDRSVTLYCQQFVSENCCHQNINVNKFRSWIYSCSQACHLNRFFITFVICYIDLDDTLTTGFMWLSEDFLQTWWEPSGFMNGREFLDELHDFIFSSKSVLHRMSDSWIV